MLWQNWGENDVESAGVEHESAPPNPDSASWCKNQSSKWLFSPDSEALMYPKYYNETPSTTTSGIFSSSPIDGSLATSDGSFWQAMEWEQWDTRGGFENGGIGGLETQQTLPVSVVGMIPDEKMMTIPIQGAPRFSSNGKSFASIEKSFWNDTKDPTSSVQSYKTGELAVKTTKEFMPLSMSMELPTDAESWLLENSPTNQSRAMFVPGQNQGTKRNEIISIKTESVPSPLTSMPSSQRDIKGCRRRGSGPLLPDSGRASRPQARRPQSNGNVEKDYRARLTNNFADLLQALPAELVLKTSSGKIRANKEKPISKFETMGYAISHMKQLESDGQKLEEEGLKLRGQMISHEKLFAQWSSNGRAGL
jgi:hypothetical protein